ncbi:hypothetical protein BBJ29_007127 [Phytophthora kernoviae]|uniref:K Homology domain-containing protein n=1 Tax=Phytophthora kernoviae TaxID=325452 RepID=A0A421FXC1_9STRA|nr:hypothetical protein BBJ29_007127 [Phytophthora kernoviae]
MLDQRGKLIREISDKSGAYTHFLAPHDEENRICVFSGDLSCVLRAQRLVLQIIAGDAISSKRLAPTRKRKRSRRDEEEEQYEEMEDEGEYMRDEVPYYEDEIDDEYYDNEYEEAPRPVLRRQKIVRRQPLSQSRHDFDVEEDVYEYDNDTNESEYEERSRQPLRRRAVATRPREYFEDDYDLDRYDHEESIIYGVPQPRVPKRPAVVRRLPHGSRRAKYDDDEYGYEYDYEDHDDAEYEQLLLPRKQVIRRRPISGRGDDRRSALILPHVQVYI